MELILEFYSKEPGSNDPLSCGYSWDRCSDLLSMLPCVYKLRSKFSMSCLIIWRGTLPTNIKPRLNAWLETLASPSVILLGARILGEPHG